MQAFAPISATEVFPNSRNELADLKSLLSSLNLHSTLTLCANLNIRLSDAKRRSNQNDLIQHFFNRDQISLIKHYFQNVHTEQTASVFHRGQILELIRWACLYCGNKAPNTFEADDEKQKFAQAALIASDLWQKRVYRPLIAASNNIHITRESSLGPLRLATSESSYPLDILRACGRGKLIFEEIYGKYRPTFEMDFLKVTGLSIQDYYNVLFIFLILQEEGQGFLINIEALNAIPFLSERLEAFLQLESQTPEELKAAIWQGVEDPLLQETYFFDKKPLRNKPFLKISGGKIVIIDPVFLTEKASIGLLFHLLRTYPSRDIFSAFGYAFEDYAQRILKKMYPTSNVDLFDRLKCNPFGSKSDRTKEEISDAALDDQGQTVLFEMKAKFIREEILLLDDANEYIESVIGNYSNNQPRLQLATKISKLVSGELVPDHGWQPAERIYPVLLCHDSLLASLGYSWMFSEAFKSGLEPDISPIVGDMRKGNHSITPLILMTIDDLEDLEESIQDFSLCKLLSDYSAKSPDRSISLADYIRSSRYKDLIDTRGMIFSKSMQFLEETMNNLDPDWNPDDDELIEGSDI